MTRMGLVLAGAIVALPGAAEAAGGRAGTATPQPGELLLLALGLAALLIGRRSARNRPESGI